MADSKNSKITSWKDPEKRYEYLFQARFSLPEPWKGYEQERRLDRELRKAIERFANGEKIISLLNRGLRFERAIELATGQTLANQNEDCKWELKEG